MNPLSLLQQVCGFFAAVFGPKTEVVIHDMQTGEIVWIANGEITGRSTGKTEHLHTIRVVANRTENGPTPGTIIGYRSFASNATPLRSSNLFMRGEDGEYRYSICVNQDISPLMQFKGFMDEYLMENPRFKSEEDGNTVDNLIMDIIVGEIEKAKPFSLDSREARLRILKSLDEKGVFEVRYAGTKVCDMLEIAQPTLYKYLKEIRREQDRTGDDECDFE